MTKIIAIHDRRMCLPDEVAQQLEDREVIILDNRTYRLNSEHNFKLKDVEDLLTAVYEEL